jgi:hypothetical protein
MKRSRITIGAILVAAAIAATAAGIASSTANSPTAKAKLHQVFMRHLQQLSKDGLLSWASRAAVAKLAGGQAQSTPAEKPLGQAPTRAAGIRAAGPPGPGLTNVRVNDPAADSQFIDQTTQSETAIGVTGQNVVVGFNDSQTVIPTPFITAGLNLTGYSYSSDGGKTFTDEGTLPNAPGMNNLGDPWLGTDRAGNVFFSNLVVDYAAGNLDVGVARSTNGGKTFSTPTIVSPSNDLFYSGDKDALAVGPDPVHHSQDDVYVAWDDQFADQSFNIYDGLPVAHSTDGGQTWQVTYADKILLDPNSCSFAQYIGSTPAVAPDGTLYVVAEKFSVDDPTCTGQSPFVASEWVFKSTDGGQTFDAGQQLATVTETGDLQLGPGQFMRNLELPAIAIDPKGNVYVAWNDAASGHSNIRLATSTNGGSTWALSWATNGPNDQVQPALSADKSGVHLIYYQRNPDNTLDVMVGNSKDGKKFNTKRVTSQSFPGVFTVPQFDPIIADAYMGDYIANVSDGTDQYFAWGDNRDIVTNFLWPNGRHDPNVYLAKQ